MVYSKVVAMCRQKLETSISISYFHMRHVISYIANKKFTLLNLKVVMLIRCFLIDEAGYVIVHPDMLIPPKKRTSIPNITNWHITGKLSIYIVYDVKQYVIGCLLECARLCVCDVCLHIHGI